jgi:hypothetical protein
MVPQDPNRLVRPWTPEEARRWAQPSDLVAIAEWVHRGYCQCCGYDDDELEALPCGHRRCELCADRDHFCMACAVAMWANPRCPAPGRWSSR